MPSYFQQPTNAGLGASSQGNNGQCCKLRQRCGMSSHLVGSTHGAQLTKSLNTMVK